MYEYLERVITIACSVELPKTHAACAVEKYIQFAPAELNQLVDKRILETAEHFRFDAASHLDWAHSGITTKDADGEDRLLDAFFLKYPVAVVPEAFQIELEYFWKIHYAPYLLRGVSSVDSYCEAIAERVFHSLDSYTEALQRWALMGRPSDTEDCLQGAKKSELRKHEKIQRRRVANRESMLGEFRRLRAPTHLIEAREGMVYREHLVYNLIRESIRAL